MTADRVPTRAEAHTWLDTFLDQLDQPNQITSTAARIHLIHLAMLVADIAGKRLGRIAFPNIFDLTDKEKGMSQLADRLALAGRMLGRLGEGGGLYTIQAAIDEIRALAGGDEPKLFANRPVGTRDEVNAQRLASHKIVALQWKEYLLAKGLKAGRCDDMIASAFGETWGTIYKWTSRLKDRLGQDAFSDRLMWARECGVADRPFKRRQIPSLDQDALAADGWAYAREKGRKVGFLNEDKESIG